MTRLVDMSVREAAEALGVSVHRVRALAQAGLLMKRRAQQVDTSAARARHGDDLAVLWACVAEPLAVEVSKKERKVLRSAAANVHWGVLDPDAAEAGRTAADLIAGP